MWIEALTTVTIRRRSGDVRLLPGKPMDLPEDEALKLLVKAQGKVREATGSCDYLDEGKSTRALAPRDRITWGPEGTLRGPATVEFLHTDPDGTEWAFVTLPDGRWTAVKMKFVKGSGHD